MVFSLYKFEVYQNHVFKVEKTFLNRSRLLIICTFYEQICTVNNMHMLSAMYKQCAHNVNANTIRFVTFLT